MKFDFFSKTATGWDGWKINLQAGLEIDEKIDIVLPPFNPLLPKFFFRRILKYNTK